ncbi:MAG: asparagine--tRNA ligase [Deltaproteobacteria bacterium]|nr:asparagine--tRNA ligase [Deltaproteobacteria bacterium]MBW2134265.1 asparagine--tRNA ligase [Deltaproteobacteria bacterium]
MTTPENFAYIAHLSQRQGQSVTIRGWLYNKRSSGKVRFLLIRDGTGIVQGVMVKGHLPEGEFEQFDLLTQESSLMVQGQVRAEARAPGGYELEVTSLQPLHIAAEYPISPKEHGVAFLLEHRHLWLRSPRQQAILRVRDEVIRACRDFFADKGFVLIDTPIFTPAACEGTTTLFQTDYFDQRKAYLSQSGQLYLEAAAMALGKVYCLGPTFRAEKSKTRRHLTEFWMLETEVAFAELDDIMALAEALIGYLVSRVLDRRQAEFQILERPLEPLRAVQAPFPQLSYAEARQRLEEAGHQLPWGQDLGGADETRLSEMYDRPVMVHRYPRACKAFYMKADPADPRLALCIDILAPEGYGEIIGGSQREDDLETLINRLQEYQLPRQPFEWYLDLRRYGSVPHSGFGLGIERLVSWLCGLKHVREAIPFPRLLDRIYP